MAPSKSKISRLVRQLNSTVEADAKSAASWLDALLYPNFGPGPREVSATESERITGEHYDALRGSDAIKPLLETMVNGTDFARAYAATALGAIGESRALPLLLNALSAASAVVRQGAIQGLKFFREVSTVPAIVRLLDDPVLEVRQAAATTLGLIGSADAVPALMAFYERGDRESKVSALWAFAYIGDPRSLPLARAALLDKVRKVREAAKFALAQYDFKRRTGS